MIGGQPSASSIQFSWTIGRLDPSEKVLDYTLIYLVEDIWRDRAVDMYER